MSKLLITVVTLILMSCGPITGTTAPKGVATNVDCCTLSSHNECKLYEVVGSSEIKKICKHESVWSIPCIKVLKSKESGKLFCHDNTRIEMCFECE